MTCANIDGVSTAMSSSCSDAFSLPNRILDHLPCGRSGRLDHPVLALPLGFVERIVGGLEQRLGTPGVGEGGHPETRGDRHLDTAAGRDPATFDRGPRALGETHTALGIGAAEDERELLAAPAAGSVALAPRLAEGTGELLQHDVADGVAEPVVDELEVVEVREHEACAAAEASRARELRAQRRLDAAAVREAR